MRRQLALIALASLAGCSCGKKMPADMVAYEDPGRVFSCHAPAHWRVREERSGSQKIAFFGPPDGAKPFSSSIGVYHYPPGSSVFASPEDYARSQALAGQATPLAPYPRPGAGAQSFTLRRRAMKLHGLGGDGEERREEIVLVPAGRGFFALVYSAPESSFARDQAMFRALVESFKPGP